MHAWFMRAALAALSLTITATGSAKAQSPANFPTKPISLIVSNQPGVSLDLLLRGFAEAAARHLGQPVVVDNKAGASGTLSAVALATNAKPDGYSIGAITLPIIRLPHMQRTPYDVKDFTYILQLGGYMLGGVVKGDSPFKTWAEAKAYAKANPKKFTYTTIGPATTNAIAMELMARHDGMEVTHIPGKGGGEAIAAVLGGHVTMMVESSAWAPLVNSGELKLLFLLGAERSKKWPAIPALPELGYPWSFDSAFGLAAPKGTDPMIVKKLHDAFKKAMDDPLVTSLYDKFDFSRRYLDSAAYRAEVLKTSEEERVALIKLGLKKE